jgi:N-hydroxyarylamine O-acetyltransferase
MKVADCLARIGYSGQVTPDITTLRALQLAFLLKVPFENLDIHLGREITLNPEGIFDKIVRKGRGGVCYENNIMFYELLRALGYRVGYLSARIVKGRRVGPEYDHMVLLVALDRDYIIDVGRGAYPREPLPLDGAVTSSSEDCYYKVGRHGMDYALYGRRSRSDWSAHFIFSAVPRARSEFECMNRYHQTSPASPFTRRRLATIATSGGCVTLIDRRLSITDGADRRERELGSEAEYRQGLKRYFGIELDGDLAWSPQTASMNTSLRHNPIQSE